MVQYFSFSYAKSVAKNTTRLETLLKMVHSPVVCGLSGSQPTSAYRCDPQQEPPDAFVNNYTLLVGDSSFANFQKILDLKGTPRAQQNNLLDMFLTMTSTMGDLETTSFMSTLDMDPLPPGAATANAMLSPSPSLLSLTAGGVASAMSNAGIPSGLSTPPLGSLMGGFDTPRGGGSASGAGAEPGKVLSDLRRLVSFAVKRDRTALGSQGNT